MVLHGVAWEAVKAHESGVTEKTTLHCFSQHNWTHNSLTEKASTWDEVDEHIFSPKLNRSNRTWIRGIFIRNHLDHIKSLILSWILATCRERSCEESPENGGFDFECCADLCS